MNTTKIKDPAPPEHDVPPLDEGAAPGTSALAGIRWTAVGQAAGQGTRFGVNIVLARLLVPEQFGLLAMATVVTGFVSLFQSLGTTGVVIQRKELSEALFRTLASLNLVMGAVLGCCVYASGPLMAIIFVDENVTSVVQALAITLPISALGIAPRAALTRQRMFSRLAMIEFTTAVLQGTIAIVLAWNGWGVWALVAATVVQSIVSSTLVIANSPRKCRFGVDLSELRECYRFAMGLVGSQIAAYFFKNGDRFLVGRYLGAASLGLYSMAFALCMVPITFLSRVLNRVLFPEFSRIQDDDAALKKGFTKATAGIAMAMFPAMVGLALVADPFVMTCLGADWEPAIPLIVAFSIVGLLQSMAVATGSIYLAKGRSDYMFVWEVSAGLAKLAAVTCGLKWGVLGVAYAFAVVMVPLTYLSFVLSCRLIGLRVRDVAVAVSPFAVCTGLMGSIVYLQQIVMASVYASSATILVSSIAIGVVSQVVLLWLIQPCSYVDARRLLCGR